jgi:glycosyltransferase involved in cell wall biosynthesis
VIALKFPAYLIPHPNKVLWLVHQHRTAYDLWHHPLCDLMHFPNGSEVRDAIRHADCQLIPECRGVFSISRNVTKRLRSFCKIASTPIYHPPPDAAQFRCEPADDYLLFPSRLAEPKRQELVLEALSQTRSDVRVCFVGKPDAERYLQKLRDRATELRIHRRVDWRGSVTDTEKQALYARALAVIFPPIDEDYGYITLESMLASKPVITCTDSGGPLEFVRDGESGFVVAPTPHALAAAFDHVWTNRGEARALGKTGRQAYDNLEISWSGVVRRLAA